MVCLGDKAPSWIGGSGLSPRVASCAASGPHDRPLWLRSRALELPDCSTIAVARVSATLPMEPSGSMVSRQEKATFPQSIRAASRTGSSRRLPGWGRVRIRSANSWDASYWTIKERPFALREADRTAGWARSLDASAAAWALSSRPNRSRTRPGMEWTIRESTDGRNWNAAGCNLRRPLLRPVLQWRAGSTARIIRMDAYRPVKAAP